MRGAPASSHVCDFLIKYHWLVVKNLRTWMKVHVPNVKIGFMRAVSMNDNYVVTGFISENSVYNMLKDSRV